jgi:hypothetical protein
VFDQVPQAALEALGHAGLVMNFWRSRVRFDISAGRSSIAHLLAPNGT